mmetsp:Transcript_12210/g.34633  ORF Transcript_12210/g.34633 Transcript_12210/m.34633 type:complete len:226 (-) Transcript_12210:1416-2093(-)
MLPSAFGPQASNGPLDVAALVTPKAPAANSIRAWPAREAMTSGPETPLRAGVAAAEPGCAPASSTPAARAESSCRKRCCSARSRRSCTSGPSGPTVRCAVLAAISRSSRCCSRRSRCSAPGGSPPEGAPAPVELAPAGLAVAEVEHEAAARAAISWRSLLCSSCSWRSKASSLGPGELLTELEISCRKRSCSCLSRSSNSFEEASVADLRADSSCRNRSCSNRSR